MISGLFSLLGAAVLVVIDQLIKHWATAALLPVGNMDLLPGIVELRYCLNDGMAFSMLAGKQTLLIGMTSVMLVVVAVMLFTRKMPVWERISWTLILGGGVGNLIDRVLNGVVVDYTGALRIVRSLKEKLEARLGTELVNCAIAMPAGTESSVKTHQYVAEGAGLEVTNILDEPSAANAIYQIEDGVVVDIGGGTTGLAILKEGKVVQIEDEPTGGTHLTLVLSGNYHVSFEEAEAIKQDYKRHREILPVVRPVVEKMATIVSRYVDKAHTDTIYLCGGTCCLTGIEDIFQKVTGIRTIKPANPFLVTPTGIAMNCTLE